MSLALLLAWIPTASADCPEIKQTLDSAEIRLRDLRLDVAERDLVKAEEQMSKCTSVLPGPMFGRLWMLDGVLRTLQKDDSAVDSFAAAWRVAPGMWRNSWGSGIQRQYDEGKNVPTGRSTLVVEPELGTHRLFVDGEQRDDGNLTAGLHAIQIVTTDDRVEFGQILFLPDGETLAVATGVEPGSEETPEEVVGPKPAPSPVPEPRPPRQSTVKPLPIVAAGLAVGGAGMLAWSQERRGAMKSADDPTELRSAWTQHNIASGAGLGLLAGGVATATIHFVL